MMNYKIGQRFIRRVLVHAPHTAAVLIASFIEAGLREPKNLE